MNSHTMTQRLFTVERPFMVNHWKQTPERVEPVLAVLLAAAARYGIEPALAVAMIAQESGFDRLARSGKGALGPAQLMPGTASGYGCTDRTDPVQAFDAWGRYMASSVKRWPGRPDLWLAAYNAGPGAVSRAGNAVPPYRETQAYVPKVLDRAAKLRTLSAPPLLALLIGGAVLLYSWKA
jgi:soluble lytic murein transglycosylase-like protein